MVDYGKDCLSYPDPKQSRLLRNKPPLIDRSTLRRDQVSAPAKGPWELPQAPAIPTTSIDARLDPVLRDGHSSTVCRGRATRGGWQLTDQASCGASGDALRCICTDSCRRGATGTIQADQQHSTVVGAS